MPTRRELTLQNKKDPRTDVGSGIFFLLCKLRCIEDKLNKGQNTGAEAVFIGHEVVAVGEGGAALFFIAGAVAEEKTGRLLQQPCEVFGTLALRYLLQRNTIQLGDALPELFHQLCLVVDGRGAHLPVDLHGFFGFSFNLG